MKMRKTLSLVLSAALVLALAACGGGGGTPQNSSGSGEPDASKSAPGASSSQPEEVQDPGPTATPVQLGGKCYYTIIFTVVKLFFQKSKNFSCQAINIWRMLITLYNLDSFPEMKNRAHKYDHYLF